ncbi:hypothetical protein KSF73_10790 [Burkholderiaceae bacterium DAT-1]|nr:hypothetical protein [Burkholderiaceae bacterium DAT-1]
MKISILSLLSVAAILSGCAVIQNKEANMHYSFTPKDKVMNIACTESSTGVCLFKVERPSGDGFDLFEVQSGNVLDIPLPEKPLAICAAPEVVGAFQDWNACREQKWVLTSEGISNLIAQALKQKVAEQ